MSSRRPHRLVALLVAAAACTPLDPAPLEPPQPPPPAPSAPRVDPAAPLSPDRLTFVGSFRVPPGVAGTSTFAFGGSGLAFRPGPDDPDGYPGTLFAIGHVEQSQVAEISIPAPVASADPAELPVASFVQPFADVTGGLGAAATPDARLGDIEYLDGRLHWSLHRWYNVAPEQLPGHGWSSPDLAAPAPQGPWTLGGYHNQLTGGPLFAVPADWAAAATGGQRLVAGLNIRQGVSSSSQGPAMFAYSDAGADVVPPGGALRATPLAYYPHADGQGSTPDPVPPGGAPLPGHLDTDGWTGATWIEAGDAAAVLVTGRRGSSNRYGEGEPGDCDADKGYHGEPYRPAFLFYDPADLAAVAAGELAPWDVRPYAETDPAAGLTPSCRWELSGATFDADHGLLYVMHTAADTVTSEWDPYPVVHVFTVA